MDILRVLSTPDLEVRKKTLQLALDLVSSRNVEEVKHITVVLKNVLIFNKIAYKVIYITKYSLILSSLILKKSVFSI